MPNYADLVDPDAGMVSAQIFADAQVYEDELDKVFGRCWLFLAHESMLPKPGDYLTTTMGEDPVVVVRQRDGEIIAFLNQCRHKGMRICRADGGNARGFTCTYHGWTYDLAGSLTQVPHEQDAYFGELDKSRLAASRVPRLVNHRGFVFGNWDPDAMSFEDYMGDMLWYFDSFADRWPRSEVVGEANRWTIACNWKLPAEQFAADSYHAETSHVSALMAQAADQTSDALRLDPDVPGAQFASPMGHGTGFFLSDVPDMTDYGPVVDAYRERIRPQEIERLGETRALLVRGHNTVFPNFSFLVGTNTMRVWHPRGPNALEVATWTLVDADAPPEVKDAMRRNAIRTFTAGGMFEAEDGENWAEIQDVLRGRRARDSWFTITMGLGHSVRGKHGLPGMIGSIYSEEASRSFYRRWAELMSAPAATAVGR